MSDVTTQTEETIEAGTVPSLWYRAQSFFDQWGHRLPLAFFIGGFIFDTFTLTRIDQAWDQFILTLHLVNVTVMVLLMQLAWRVRRRDGSDDEEVSKAQSKSWVGKYAHWYPNLFQLSLGALFSGFFIFFSRSGTLVESWPFILLLIGFLVGNELFKDRYERFVFQMSVYYFVLFLFLILFVPVILSKIGWVIFLLSGLLSLGLFVMIVLLISRIIPRRVEKTKETLTLSVLGIFALMNVLYFTNIIPPIPLALKDVGIYHSVTKLRDGTYQVQYESPRWYQPFKRSEKDFNRAPGMSVYAFASVFAPTDLETTILHDWEFYDEQEGEWTSTGKVVYQITGGRDGGFRGFSFKDNVQPGHWRVNVETQRGQLLGRKTFEIHEIEKQPELVTSTR